MEFAKLSEFLQNLEETPSRNKMIEILAELFKVSDRDEIDKICYLSLGQLAPLYEGIEFNLAEKMMIRALAQSFNLSESKIKKHSKKLGDLGDVVTELKPKTRALKLSVLQVYKRLYEIAMEGGKGSVRRKISKMATLLGELDSLSAKYAVRIPLGKLRLGFSELTIMDALSWMTAGDKSKRKEIEEAYNVRADIGQIVRLVKEKGLKGLA
ncbi:DNA ligase, partial [Candidatus Shapirobacteria bacterium CG10_big_fil_rev_8_21_14_0_10_40_9]